ncbi:MBOAT family O-acyltransferase [Flagellimonas meridianipacifica]|uniref:D-alanyl-lipoteichoic acid acyltransferase DltB (MBOAT superfamily) n=1 Tax=Flagellimonas meridianipacifica TaxID=1080225 RepID=A0A2T0MCR4_9FLAO|nr:MBOAT family O-acyltransferase [Allomuricauda pacifica]PRX55273.1 D-alanyl-lipoteichoic acid acyltransferase DltB (MBOAT superfamily) [Allomuricauda pacifica]
MLFNSFEFLLFLPIMILGFYLIPHKYRWLWLLGGSYYFYMVHEPELVLLLMTSTLVDYCCGIWMESSTKSRKKWLLALSVFTNIGILISFKYLDFFATIVRDIIGLVQQTDAEENNYGFSTFSQILLPVGISFYTFQTLSYTIDVYRGELKAERHLGKFALYVSFFPQLVAGPIERAHRLLPQLKNYVRLNVDNLRRGLIIMAWGFFLKVVVADRLGIYVDEAFSDPQNHKGLPLWISAGFFTLQVYYDFAAYTAIAIGAAKTIGVDLMSNFDRPFFSPSFAQLWRRWHISLVEWIRDYLYLPMINNLKMGKVAAIFAVFFIIGLWHGANWTFVFWGLSNALLLVIEGGTKKWRLKLLDRMGFSKKSINILGTTVGFPFIMLTTVFFRSPTLTDAFLYFKQMLSITNMHINILGNYLELFLCFLFIAIAQTIHYFKGNVKVYELVEGKPTYWRWTLYGSYVFLIVFFALNRQNTFIYFQF